MTIPIRPAGYICLAPGPPAPHKLPLISHPLCTGVGVASSTSNRPQTHTANVIFPPLFPSNGIAAPGSSSTGTPVGPAGHSEDIALVRLPTPAHPCLVHQWVANARPCKSTATSGSGLPPLEPPLESSAQSPLALAILLQQPEGEAPTLVCGRTWTIMPAAPWKVTSRHATSKNTSWPPVPFAASSSPNGITGSILDAARWPMPFLLRHLLLLLAHPCKQLTSSTSFPRNSQSFAMCLVVPGASGPNVLPELSAQLPPTTRTLPGLNSWCFPKLSFALPHAAALPVGRRPQISPPPDVVGGSTVSGTNCGPLSPAGGELSPLQQRDNRPNNPAASLWQLKGNIHVLALLEASPDIQQKLLAKHPRATAARPGLLGLGPAPVGAVPDITTHAVSNAVRGFRRGTAAGPSGLRSDHLREALQTAHCDEVLTHLTAVVHLLAAGQVPLDLAPHLAGATLHALPKGDADVRPIAVGETLRRLVAKCLCHTVKDLARDYLHPLQVGVSVPLGAEAAIHTARQWCQRSAGKSDMVFLSLDFENAFNSIDRLGMLREIRLRFPGLAPWAEWTYGGPSRLLFHGEAFTSEAGVQQGDPLGPLFFALALQPALRAVGLRIPSGPELLFAYLDDVCLAGSWHEVASALQRLHRTARQVGLRLNPHKCILTTCAGSEHSVDLAAFPSGFQLNTSGQFSILGAPIGPASFCESFTSTKRIETAKPLLHQIAELPDPQTGLLLLRDCASWCKFSFSTRVTPPASITQASANFDNEIRHCLESMCTGPLSPDAWLQASLSTSSGGLGLRHSARHGPAAYAISLFHTQLLCNALDPHYQSNHSDAFQSATQDVLPADRLPTPLPPTLRQQQLSQALDKATVEHLARPAPGREAFRAHLKLLQQPGAGAWLHAPPSEALGPHVASSLFIVMVQMRLRLPVGDQDMPCPLCDGVLDRHGDHARVCPCRGDRTKRHHRLRSIVAARAHAAGLHPEIEKAGLLPPRPDDGGGPEDGARQAGGGRRPADVWVGSWGLHGAAAFDLAVTSGLRQGSVAASATAGERAAADYEANKCAFLNTHALCQAEGLQFLPLVAEAIGGGWGPTAVATWKSLGAAIAARLGEPSSLETSRLYQALGITLHRENARAVLRRRATIPDTRAFLDEA